MQNSLGKQVPILEWRDGVTYDSELRITMNAKAFGPFYVKSNFPLTDCITGMEILWYLSPAPACPYSSGTYCDFYWQFW